MPRRSPNSPKVWRWRISSRTNERSRAVALNLIILGEAATKLMDRHPDIAACYPGIEWRSMRGMRNRIAHGYYDIDMDIVWRTIVESVPVVIGALQP